MLDGFVAAVGAAMCVLGGSVFCLDFLGHDGSFVGGSQSVWLPWCGSRLWAMVSRMTWATWSSPREYSASLPARVTVTRLFPRSVFRCWETSGWDNWVAATKVLTDEGFPDRTQRMRRREAVDSALNSSAVQIRVCSSVIINT